MAEFKLPELGENVSSGTIAKVLVAVGDTVAKDQSVLEIETDKAVAEIPSPSAGKITEIRVKEGQKVKKGDVVMVIEEGSGAGNIAPEKPKAAEKTEPETKPAPAPQAAPSPPRPAPQLKVIEKPATAPRVAAQAPAGAVVASPSVRRVAREHGVDVRSVPARDPSGRVTVQDILDYVNGTSAPQAALAPSAAPKGPAPTDNDKWGAVAYEPMSGIRTKTAERMASNWTTIPHVTHFEKADVTALEEVRKKYGKPIEAQGGKLTVTSFIVKVIGEALKRFPKFNASIDLENNRLIYKSYYNVGIAVDTPNGLLVPVMRDVDRKSIAEISAEMPAMAAKARDRKLTLDDMQGGTFTISNLGGLGGNAFTPIINSPEVAILGVSRSTIEPVWQNGQFAPRTMLPLSLSYDHRVIDGADAARFSRWVCEALENPWMLFVAG